MVLIFLLKYNLNNPPPNPRHDKLEFLSNLATSLIFSIILVNSLSWPPASRSQWMGHGAPESC